MIERCNDMDSGFDEPSDAPAFVLPSDKQRCSLRAGTRVPAATKKESCAPIYDQGSNRGVETCVGLLRSRVGEKACRGLCGTIELLAQSAFRRNGKEFGWNLKNDAFEKVYMHAIVQLGYSACRISAPILSGNRWQWPS